MRLAQMMIAFALVAICGAARAEQYPTRPITLVVPFAAGGSNDTIARVIGERLNKAWGRPVIVENQSGAGGSLAAARVAKATPDGYTLLITSPNFTINAVVQRELPFDPATAFTAVALLARSPMVLVTAPQRGFKSAAELLDPRWGAVTSTMGDRASSATAVKAVAGSNGSSRWTTA